MEKNSKFDAKLAELSIFCEEFEDPFTYIKLKIDEKFNFALQLFQDIDYASSTCDQQVNELKNILKRLQIIKMEFQKKLDGIY